jgi:hypothetical protein
VFFAAAAEGFDCVAWIFWEPCEVGVRVRECRPFRGEERPYGGCVVYVLGEGVGEVGG